MQWRCQPTEVVGKVERDLSGVWGTEVPQWGPGASWSWSIFIKLHDNFDVFDHKNSNILFV